MLHCYTFIFSNQTFDCLVNFLRAARNPRQSLCISPSQPPQPSPRPPRTARQKCELLLPAAAVLVIKGTRTQVIAGGRRGREGGRRAVCRSSERSRCAHPPDGIPPFARSDRPPPATSFALLGPPEVVLRGAVYCAESCC